MSLRGHFDSVSDHLTSIHTHEATRARSHLAQSYPSPFKAASNFSWPSLSTTPTVQLLLFFFFLILLNAFKVFYGLLRSPTDFFGHVEALELHLSPTFHLEIRMTPT